MNLTALLAVVCMVVGFIGAVIDETLLMPALAWFVLAIAFNTLAVTYTLGRKP